MIHLRYAVKLARTKLHSKRGMLIASVVVASLLFAALIAAVIVFSGAEKSATTFVKAAGNNRYLVKTTPVIPYESVSYGGELSLDEIREIKAFEKTYYEELRAKYKALNVPYDQSIEVAALQPAAWISEEVPEEQRVMINYQSPVIAALESQKYAAYAKTATNTVEDLKKIGSRYGAEGYYGPGLLQVPSIPYTRLIQNGAEDFSADMKSGNSSSYGYFINSIFNSQYTSEDERLLGRFILPQKGKELKGIPIIVSAQEAASLFGKQFGIGEEPKTATERNEWLKKIQSKFNGYTYQSCYRNSAEQTLLAKIQRDYADIKNNEGNKEYIKPNLIYDYPATPCGDIIVKTDTRTTTEKKVEKEAEEIQKKLGTYVAPAHHLLTFQIVGIINAQPYTEYALNAESYIQSLLAPMDISASATIPTQMYASLPDTLKIGDISDFKKLYNSFSEEDAEKLSPRVLEFASIDDARAFMANETCPNVDSNCAKQYRADPYGSNYLILDEIGKLFVKITSIAFPIVLGLAAIIIWFTISRIMTENRKETAIYRAMGAKRPDITAIYGTYILLVALQIAVASLVLGTLAAFIIDRVYGPQLTAMAASAFGIIENAPRFNLFDVSSPLLWIVTASIFVISIIASIQPLIRNVLRSPIRDIREE